MEIKYSFKGHEAQICNKAECPIVPVALIDSFNRFDTNHNYTGCISCSVHFL